MRQESLEFLKELVNNPSPSGFEGPSRKVWQNYVRPYVESLYTDNHGNSISVINPNSEFKVMLAGHIDEIGFMVSSITENGLIKFIPIGGVDDNIVPGKKVYIHSKNGKILGVIGKKAIHTMEESERGKVVKIKELWIDIGLKKKEEVEEYIEIGDPITFTYEFDQLSKDIICARGFDDRIGAWVVAEVMRELSFRKPKVAVYGVATVQEEIGLRGAKTSSFGINPDLGIAIDVTFATDTPDMSNFKNLMGDVKLGEGPVILRGPNASEKLYRSLVNVAKEKGIKYQIEVSGRATGTDANAIQVNAAGVTTGLISIPTRYMHTPVELVSLFDIENTVNLIVEFIMTLTNDSSFIPE